MERYHSGERAVQERAGVRAMAEKIARGIHDAIPPPARAFLAEQRLVFLATVDRRGRAWASVLTGAPGFMRADDERTLRIDATIPTDDPLRDPLQAHGPVGVLAIDFAGRRRMRINGVGELDAGGLRVHARQVYANCPRYIQARTIDPAATAPVGARVVRRGTTLTAAEREWIARADTFIIASAHAEAGADASHRGGDPGFVRVIDAATLAWPDYAGNTMFQTLGNLAVDEAAGLLFLDFERGATLQLTGKARIVWDGELPASFPGAERAVELAIDEVIETDGNLWHPWTRPDPSPHNPSAPVRL